MLFAVLQQHDKEVLKFYEKTRDVNWFSTKIFKATPRRLSDGTTKDGRNFYALEFEGNFLGYRLMKQRLKGYATVLPYWSDNWYYKDES